MSMANGETVTSLTVARRLLELADEGLDHLQLQKLVYYANGWHLAFADVSMTTDSVHAWEYGPVYPQMYRYLKKYRKDVIRADSIKDDVVDEMSQGHESMTREIFDKYGHFSGFKLSAMTHQRNTPWYETYFSEGNRFGIIPQERIREYFLNLIARR